MGSGVLPLAMATRPASPAFRGQSLPRRRPGDQGSEEKMNGIPVPGPGRKEASWVGVFAEAFAAHLISDLCDLISGMVLAAGCGHSGAIRAISTARLRGLPRFHLRPIDVMVSHGSRRDLVLRRVSRLDAFSGYPVRT